MPTLPPVPPNISEIAAPLLLGVIWNWSLFGALVVQFYVYSYNFPGDKRLIKLLVYSVFLLETLQTALSGADIYYWFVSGFGNMDHLASPYASAFDVPIIGAAVSVAVQFFFAYRIWVLGGREFWWICAIIYMASTIDASAAMGGGIYAHIHGKFSRGKILKILAMIWLIGNTVSDGLIAASLLYHLRKLKKREGQLSSNTLVSIVRLTVETNILTTTVGIITLVVILVFPDKNWYTCPTAIFGKLYSNTLLVTLNNRISLRGSSGARREGIIRSPAGTFPGSSPRSEGIPDIMLMDLEKPPTALKAHPLGERGTPERVFIPRVVA